MILGKCFSESHVRQCCKEMNLQGTLLLEKSIHALALLGSLSESGIPFVFKGGTSLLLHLTEIRRLSIDIDIVSHVSKEQLTKVLDKITSTKPFNKYVEVSPGFSGKPDMLRFEVHYDPIIDTTQPYVLLEVVEEENCPLPCEQKTISASFINTDRDVKVTTPTVNALLGDKLTAFAPNTIGVHYQDEHGASTALQVVKQLFDIGELFDHVTDMAEVRTAYKASYAVENKYYDERYSLDQVINDTADTALALCRYNKGDKASVTSDISAISLGIDELRNHLVRNEFRLKSEAQIAAAKTYALAEYARENISMTVNDRLKSVNDKISVISNTNLPDEYRDMEHLKQINPKAFYYLALGMGKLT
ncbi:nucleotidyl transferase AbiEii/AbiGii toxin family protein [Pontiellaceae bacterium B12227]|nr:nucleotidyl transferase AbiEii/AbiGii toxin family protein [Pontiellaceae bacterium B12227]